MCVFKKLWSEHPKLSKKIIIIESNSHKIVLFSHQFLLFLHYWCKNNKNLYNIIHQLTISSIEIIKAGMEISFPFWYCLNFMHFFHPSQLTNLIDYENWCNFKYATKVLNSLLTFTKIKSKIDKRNFFLY